MPNREQLHRSRYLENVAIQYRNPDVSYVAERIMPPVKTAKRADAFPIYDKGERFRAVDQQIGQRSEANEVEWSHADREFAVKDYGLQEFVSQDEIDNADSPFEPRSDATEFLTDLIMLGREKRVADVCRSTAVLTQNRTIEAADRWTVAGTKPLDVLLDAIGSCFVRPNTIVMGRDVWRALQTHAQILGIINPTAATLVTEEQLAKLLGVGSLLVGESWINTARKGQPASFSRIWGNDVLIAYVNPRPARRSLSFGWTFRYPVDTPYQVFEIPEPKRGPRGGVTIKVVTTETHEVVATDLAYLIKTAV